MQNDDVTLGNSIRTDIRLGSCKRRAADRRGYRHNENQPSTRVPEYCVVLLASGKTLTSIKQTSVTLYTIPGATRSILIVAHPLFDDNLQRDGRVAMTRY